MQKVTDSARNETRHLWEHALSEKGVLYWTHHPVWHSCGKGHSLHHQLQGEHAVRRVSISNSTSRDRFSVTARHTERSISTDTSTNAIEYFLPDEDDAKSFTHQHESGEDNGKCLGFCLSSEHVLVSLESPKWAAPTKNLGVRWGVISAPGGNSCLKAAKKVLAWNPARKTTLELSSKCIYSGNHPASAVCHFTLNLITVKDVIRIFLLFHYLVFSLSFFIFTWLIVLLFHWCSLYTLDFKQLHALGMTNTFRLDYL